MHHHQKQPNVCPVVRASTLTKWLVPIPGGDVNDPMPAKVTAVGAGIGLDGAAVVAVVVRDIHKGSPPPVVESLLVIVNPCSVVCAAIAVTAVPPVAMLPAQLVRVTLAGGVAVTLFVVPGVVWSMPTLPARAEPAPRMKVGVAANAGSVPARVARIRACPDELTMIWLAQAVPIVAAAPPHSACRKLLFPAPSAAVSAALVPVPGVSPIEPSAARAGVVRAKPRANASSDLILPIKIDPRNIGYCKPERNPVHYRTLAE